MKLTFAQDAFEVLIRNYTRESGVRNLETADRFCVSEDGHKNL